MSSDKDLTCVECNSTFVYSADDQQFHASKGYTEPKRCPSCRSARRNSGGGSYSGSTSYSSGGYGDSGDSYGSSRGGYSSGPREMHSATCASCGKEAQVPFVPRGDKPVYCSDCFQQQRQSSSRSSSRW